MADRDPDTEARQPGSAAESADVREVGESVYERVRSASYAMGRCGLCGAGILSPCAASDCLWRKPVYVDGRNKPHELDLCAKPDTITWKVDAATKWARDEKGRLYYNAVGTWHRAQVGR